MPRFCVIAVVSLLTFASQEAWAAVRFVSTPLPRTYDLERRLLSDGADGRLDTHSLLEAVLIAGGESDRMRIAAYRRRVEVIARDVRHDVDLTSDDKSRAKQLLHSLHRRVLTGPYLSDQSSVAVSLNNGSYNCLSSVVLYVALADTLGINATPAVLPGHIVAHVACESGPIVVETTCDNARGTSGVRGPIAGTSATNPSTKTAKPLTDAEVVALFYYNQGYEHLMRKSYRQALAANEKALRLDPDSERALGNLLATLNNWSLARAAEGDYRHALELVAYGLEHSPNYAPLRANNRHIHRKLVQRLLESGQHAEAQRVLSAAANRWPEDAYFSRLLGHLSDSL